MEAGRRISPRSYSVHSHYSRERYIPTPGRRTMAMVEEVLLQGTQPSRRGARLPMRRFHISHNAGKTDVHCRCVPAVTRMLWWLELLDILQSRSERIGGTSGPTITVRTLELKRAKCPPPLMQGANPYSVCVSALELGERIGQQMSRFLPNGTLTAVPQFAPYGRVSSTGGYWTHSF